MPEPTLKSLRLPLPLAVFMVFTLTVWCGIWIVVAHVSRWKLQLLYDHRDVVWSVCIIFITLGGGLMYLAVDQVGRGIRQWRDASARRQIEEENRDAIADAKSDANHFN